MIREFLALALAAFFDLILTLYQVRLVKKHSFLAGNRLKEAEDIEQNPIIKFFWKHFGLTIGSIIMYPFILLILGSILYFSGDSYAMALVFFGFYSAIIIYHCIYISSYHKVIEKINWKW